MAKATITAENQFTDWILVDKDYFDLIVYGTFSATVTVQEKSFGASDSDIVDVRQYTEADLPIRKVSARTRQKSEFRVGVKTGDYTSGTINVEIR